MKKLIFALAVMCGSAMAQVAPIDVAQECISQMSMGICRVPVDRSMMAPGQTMILSGHGRVQMSALADYTDLYNAKVPTDPAMCDLALHYMTEQPGGDHDKIARAYWTPIPKPEKVEQVSAADLAKAAIWVAMGLGTVTLAAMGIEMAARAITRKKVA